jgi:hypothetical protein
LTWQVPCGVGLLALDSPIRACANISRVTRSIAEKRFHRRAAIDRAASTGSNCTFIRTYDEIFACIAGSTTQLLFHNAMHWHIEKLFS